MTRTLACITTLFVVAFIVGACATGGGGRPSGGGASAAAGGGCPAPPADVARIVNRERGPVDPGVLSSAAVGMCMAEVLSRLGPAHGDSAQNMVVLSWKSTDGRTLEVGAETLSAKAAFVRWANR